MDSNLNYRRSQVGAAELHRRADLHRVAAEARATERDARPTHRRQGGFAEAVRIAYANVGRLARGAAALASRSRA